MDGISQGVSSVGMIMPELCVIGRTGTARIDKDSTANENPLDQRPVKQRDLVFSYHRSGEWVVSQGIIDPFDR